MKIVGVPNLETADTVEPALKYHRVLLPVVDLPHLMFHWLSHVSFEFALSFVIFRHSEIIVTGKTQVMLEHSNNRHSV